jgi:hypothetical protein
MRILVATAAFVGAALATGAALAHHSFAAEFDREQPVELKGIVTKIEWTNPHVWVYVNVRDEASGDTVNWGVELGPPHLLQRRGWQRNTLSIGTQVTVNGSRARNGSNRVNSNTITLAATGGQPGQTLDAASSANGANDER